MSSASRAHSTQHTHTCTLNTTIHIKMCSTSIDAISCIEIWIEDKRIVERLMNEKPMKKLTKLLIGLLIVAITAFGAAAAAAALETHRFGFLTTS